MTVPPGLRESMHCNHGCRGACRMPRWVTDGWYGNNPEKQRHAIVRWHQLEALLLTPASIAEVEAVHRYQAQPKPPTFPCSSCGRHAFAVATTCWWCRHPDVALRADVEGHAAALEQLTAAVPALVNLVDAIEKTGRTRRKTPAKTPVPPTAFETPLSLELK